MVDQLEAPDQPITLVRAAQIAGLAPQTVRVVADNGKLEVFRYGRERLTTRRMLHRYLLSRLEHGGPRKPLPPDYVAPGEEG
jgi:hypothetical protein